MHHVNTPIWGRWSLDEQGALVGKSTSKSLAIASRHDFGNRMEIRGRLEVLKTTGDSLNGGVLLQLRKHRSHRHHYDVLIHSAPTAQVAVTGDFKKDSLYQALAVQWPIEFHLSQWDAHIRLEINGQVVLDDSLISDDWDDDEDSYPPALGGYYVKDGATLRFSNLAARRIRGVPQWIGSDDQNPVNP